MKEIRPWIINVYADDRCTDTYAAYASGTVDDVEEIIGSNEELITTLVDSHIADWEDSFDEDVEGDTEEEREECFEQLREDFMSEISYECVEVDPEEADQYEIIYDERD